jgi:hypothetical protein
MAVKGRSFQCLVSSPFSTFPFPFYAAAIAPVLKRSQSLPQRYHYHSFLLPSPLSTLLFPPPTNSRRFACEVAPAFTPTSFFILICTPPAFSSHSSSPPPNHVHIQQHERKSPPSAHCLAPSTSLALLPTRAAVIDSV